MDPKENNKDNSPTVGQVAGIVLPFALVGFILFVAIRYTK